MSSWFLTYAPSPAACHGSRWSAQEASSRPSQPHSPARRAASSKGRSAHWSVKRVIGRAMRLLPSCRRGPLVRVRARVALGGGRELDALAVGGVRAFRRIEHALYVQAVLE